MHHIATRWVGRMRPCILCLRTTPFKSCQPPPITVCAAVQNRIISSAHHERTITTSLTRRSNKSQTSTIEGVIQPHKQSKRRRPFIFLGGASLCLIGFTVLNLSTTEESDDDIINRTDFSPFTIVSKEQVSPTAFILTVRASSPTSSSTPSPSPRIEEAWRHGLWSVEIKQPQLQIARHYTPLPPSPSSPSPSTPPSDLRFLVRKLDHGELSSYLSKQPVGAQLWLRGPHRGFDVARRLGAASDIVFVAGGTGIAPALQVAARLLEHRSDEEKPRVSILWANRKAADALGRTQGQGGRRGWWAGLWGAPAEREEAAPSSESTLARQISALRANHPQHFQISYFVDEEGSFINAKDLTAALAPSLTSSSTAPSTPNQLRPADPSCPWHSAVALQRLPDADDAGRASQSPSPSSLQCPCAQSPNAASDHGAGANLLCVSGPDGFVAAYAGPKRWHDGHEMQGAVQGLLGQIMRKRGKMEWGDWLVLKM
ncbi:hypothetical protein F5B20DRAFT_523810 [Whalleya microplaca]|nr:hypothetical protein F5B20DRAFT_523810 [Whalleya microplaca]